MAGRAPFLVRLMRTLTFLVELVCVTLPGDVYRLWTVKRKSVADQVIVITGGAMGIGRGLAEAFAIKYKAKVVILDVNQSESVAVVSEIRKLGGIACHYNCDVSDPDAMRACEVQIREHPAFGPADIIICNAMWLHMGLMLDMTDSGLKKSLETIRAFLGEMISRQHGHIVTMGSICSFNGEIYGAAYCSAKFALRGIMESLGNELVERGLTRIKCTTIFPYFTDTKVVSDNANGRQPTSTFYDVIPFDQCVDGIIDAILKEKYTAFIPWSITIICHFFRAIATNGAYLAGRKWLRFRYGPFTEDSNDMDFLNRGRGTNR